MFRADVHGAPALAGAPTDRGAWVTVLAIAFTCVAAFAVPAVAAAQTQAIDDDAVIEMEAAGVEPTASSDELAGAPAVEVATSDTVREPDASNAASAAPALTAASTRRPLVRQHTVGLGYQTLVMRTENASTYVIHGPGVSYDYVIGRRWGFMARTAAFFPVSGYMSGPGSNFSGSLVDIYDQHRYGVDVMLMGAHRWPADVSRGGPLGKLSMLAAAGAHLQWFTLAGLEYSPVEALSIGVGGLGRADYAINRWFSVSTQIAIAFDPFDPLDHRNAADLVVPIAWTFSVAARH
jgi:hypothetical protein